MGAESNLKPLSPSLLAQIQGEMEENKMNEKKVSDFRVDLHLHSLNSDGLNTAKEIVNLALQEGLKVIALTDHNYFSLKKKYIVGKEGHFLEVIPGCEFSTTYEIPSGKGKVEVHVIGIFPKGVDPNEFEDLFTPIVDGKQKYVEAILDKLHGLGVDLTMEEVMQTRKATGYVGRFQIAELLVKKNYATSIGNAMDRWIGNFSPYYIKSSDYVNYAPFESVIKRIQACSGFPILCHPLMYQELNKNEVRTLVKDFRDAASRIGGIEVYYQQYNEEQQAFLKELQEEAGLIPSVASDRHRPDQSFAHQGGYSYYQEMLKALDKVEGEKCLFGKNSQ